MRDASSCVLSQDCLAIWGLCVSIQILKLLFLFWPYCVYWTWMSVFFPRLGKFSALMTSGMFYTAFSFLFASGTSIMQILVHLMLFQKSVHLSSFHFNLLFYRSSSVIASTLSFCFSEFDYLKYHL